MNYPPSAIGPTDDPDALLGAAIDCAKRGDYVEAQAQLDLLLKIDADHEVAVGVLAAIYAELKESQRSADLFRRVLTINPDNVLARFQLGLVLLDLQQPQAALEAWQSGNFGPNRYLTDFYSGKALLQLDRPQDALEKFQQAQQSMPTNHILYPELLSALIKLSN